MHIIKQVKNQLKTAVDCALLSAVKAGCLPPIETPSYSFEAPAKRTHGDWFCNLALISGKVFQRSPAEISAVIAKHIFLKDTYFERCEAAPNGFLNFFYKPDFYAYALIAVRNEDEHYGYCDLRNNSQNIEKIFHNNFSTEFDTLSHTEKSQNPVYYVQYAYSRTCNILKNLTAGSFSFRPCSKEDLLLLTADREMNLIRAIAYFPCNIEYAVETRNPSILLKYLVDFSTLFHRFYNNCRIRGETIRLLYARIELCTASQAVLRNGLALLDISVCRNIET